MIDVPFPAKVPPHETVYHCHVAPVPNVPPVTVNVEETPEHTEVGEALAIEAAVDDVFNVTVVLTQFEYEFPSSCLT